MKLIPALLIALLVTAGWATLATYQWWTAAPKCDNSALKTRISELEAAYTAAKADVAKAAQVQAQVVDDGNKVAATANQSFAPLKVVTREILVDSCAGSFDDSVRGAVNQAVDLANQAGYQLPAARH